MKRAFINGKIHTLDKNQSIVEAILAEDGFIAAVGTNEEILALAGDSEKVDLEGKTVLPGLNDSHMHLLEYAYTKSIVDLTACKSAEEMFNTIREFIADHNIEEGHWVECKGWNEDDWEGKKSFDKRELDEISKLHPIYCTRICGHVNIVNSLALVRIGIDGNTAQPPNASFDIGSDGEATGRLVELMHYIYDAIPNPTVEELKKILMDASMDACKAGLTSLQTDDFESIPGRNYNDIIKAYQELADEGKLFVRVNQQAAFAKPDRFDSFYADGHYAGEGDKMFKIGPLKLFTDGSLGARTAWLFDEYSDDPGNKGFGIYEDDAEIDIMVEKAHGKGMDVAVHCIGDAAADQALRAMEKAIDKYPDFKHRDGIVHAQILSADICQRMKVNDITAYIQPIFIEYDLHIAEDRVGSSRIKTSYNWKSLKDMGIRIPFGTDCPVESLNPFENIYSAVTRKDLEGKPEGAWYKEEALTLDEAIENYTLAPAHASREEHIKGSLEVSKLADFTVLDRDIYSLEENEIKEIKAFMTVLGGKIVHKKM